MVVGGVGVDREEEAVDKIADEGEDIEVVWYVTQGTCRVSIDTYHSNSWLDSPTMLLRL
jgi:hypothetical protein